MNSLNLILDGNNIIFRAYHVVKRKEIVNGVNVSAVTQFMKMIKGYTDTFKPRNIYLVWDKCLNPNGTNFRKTLVPYKEHRNVDPEVYQEIKDCVSLISDLVESLGIKVMLPWSLEADDVISFLCENLDGEKLVISSDKDLLQLVDEEVTVFNTTKNEKVTLDNFEEFAGVPKDSFLDYKSILGDKSDNISGVNRYGEVKSKKLALSKNWEELTQEQLDIVHRNKTIIDLNESYARSDGEKESYLEQLKEVDSWKFSEESFKALCHDFQLESVLRDYTSWKHLLCDTNLLEEWFSFD